MKRAIRITVALIILQVSVGMCISRCEARNLTTVLREGFTLNPGDPDAVVSLVGTVGANGFVDVSSIGTSLAPVLSGAVANAITQQSPLASVAPAFTYRYNTALNVFERSTPVPGPLFSERAVTIGPGQLNFGVAYSYVDMDDINGTNLQGIRTPLLLEAFCPFGSLFDERCNGRLNLGLSSVRTRLTIQTHLIVPTLRYGLTENWDIGLSIPLVNTFLRVRNDLIPVVQTADAQFVFGGPQGVDFLTPDGTPATLSRVRFSVTSRPSRSLAKVAGSMTGVGDITLRTKYRLWGDELGGVAAGLELRLPSGEEKNFHGTGETHVTPFLYLSHVFWDLVEPHLNLGLDFNTTDVNRSALLYSVGVATLVWKQLGAGIDVIGRSEFGRFPIKGNSLSGFALDGVPATCHSVTPCLINRAVPFRFPFPIKRNDITDISFGFRYVLGVSGSVFLGATLPLNDDGFRADVIPSGGVEYTF